MNASQPALVVNVVATLLMVWMVQIVHYRLFDDVGEQNYLRYQQRHQTNITCVVGPVMLIRLLLKC